MKNITQRLIINVDKKNNIPVWEFKQEDDGVLLLSLYKNSIELNLEGQKLKLGCTRADGAVIELTEGITINGNNVDIQLKNNILAKAGFVECDLEISDSTGKMTTATFIITVSKKMLGTDNIEASNDVSAINKLIADVQAKAIKLDVDIKKLVQEANSKITEIDNRVNERLLVIQKDYDSLKKVIIDENAAANLQDQVNQTNAQLEQKANKDFVTYEDFGAVGDGITDDYLAIKNAHNYANLHNLPIASNNFKTYLIKNVVSSIKINTNVDWRNTNFIIDDSEVTLDNCHINIFEINCKNKYEMLTISPFTKNKKYFEELTGLNGLLHVVNDNVKHFIRKGANEDSGYSQQEVIVINNGTIVNDILWNYENISKAIFYQYDETPIVIKGGNFKTIANTLPNVYGNGVNRGIYCNRSNVTFENLTHTIDFNKSETSKPYNGWLTIHNCYNINLNNLSFEAHKVYVDENGVSMGNYAYTLKNATNVNINNLKQSNTILTKENWGLSAMNYCKDIIYNNFYGNRIDAHRGVHNLKISNSILKEITLVGSGNLEIENTSVFNGWFLTLREDYGATWNGELKISNCTFSPPTTSGSDIVIIGGRNNATWDFGYKCYFPNVIIKNFKVNVNNETDNLSFIYNKTGGSSPINIVCENDYEIEVNSGRYPYINKEYFKVENITTSKPCNMYVFYGKPQYLYSDKLNNVIEHNTITNNPQPITSLLTNYNVEIKNIVFPNKYNLIKEGKNGDTINYNNHRIIPSIVFDNCELSLDIYDQPLNICCRNSVIKKINSAYTSKVGNIKFENCVFGYKYYDKQVITCSHKASTFSNCTFILPNPNSENIDNAFIKNAYSFFNVFNEYSGGFRCMARLNNCNYKFDTSLIIPSDMATKYGIDEDFICKNVNFNIFKKIS